MKHAFGEVKRNQVSEKSVLMRQYFRSAKAGEQSPKIRENPKMFFSGLIYWQRFF